MESQSLLTIKDLTYELAKKINAPISALPDIFHKIDGAYIESDQKGNIIYVIKERGEIIFQKKASNNDSNEINELLYSIFSDVIRIMSQQYELNNREGGKDTRRMLFSKEEDLMGELNEMWRIKKQIEHSEILGMNPFSDEDELRFELIVNLRANGMSLSEARKIACDKYPPHWSKFPT